MSNHANEKMKAIAKQFDLVEGIDRDFYTRHGKWCITKEGSEKIAEAIGMEMEDITLEWRMVDKTTMAYDAWFKNREGKRVFEVGECRFDGTKNTPERQYPFAMSKKRLYGRAVLQLIGVGGSQGIMSEDEMPSDWHKHGNNAPQEADVPATPIATPVATTPATEPANAPEPSTNLRPDMTIDYTQDPRYSKARVAEGWHDNYLTLPSEWNVLMEKIANITKQDRSVWETLIFDHCGKFYMENKSTWWKPSDKYDSFVDNVFFVASWNDTNTSKAKGANRIKGMCNDEVLYPLEKFGEVVIEVPDSFGDMKQYTIKKASDAIGEDTQQVIDANKDDIAKETPPTRHDEFEPKQISPNGIPHDTPF
ncbi:MAG: hypothetical protein CMC15_15695 [Flavobacteriaceae bacterium]|nr:hypothetical protein [Flavobacteriaceae bacterium]